MLQKTELDATIDEIHRTRERLAEKFCGDIKAILADARRRQAESNLSFWRGTSANNAVKLSGESTGNRPGMRCPPPG